MFGFHIPRIHHNTEESFSKMLSLSREYGFEATCAQIFAVGPMNHTPILTQADKDYLVRADIKVVIHGAYIDNPWNFAQGTIHNIKQELRVAKEIRALGVIVHLGNNAGKTINAVLEKLDLPEFVECMLYLEINAVRASPLSFETPQKINALFAQIQPLKYLRIGLCIDTAHLYSCGCALTTYDDARRFMSALDASIPLMIHLNDSIAELGSGVDKHESLTYGNIWGSYIRGKNPLSESGLFFIIEFAKEKGLAVILERNIHIIERDFEILAAQW